MAFNPAPSGWFPGVTSTGSGITFPFTSLNSLTSGNANPVSGDVREVIFGFLEGMCDKFNDTTSGGYGLSANKPVNVVVSRSNTTSTTSGIDQIAKTYTIRVNLDIDTVSVTSE